MTTEIAEKLDWKDLFGNPIAVGDYLAYALRAGNSASLTVHKVIDYRVVQEDDDPEGKKIFKPRTIGTSWWGDSLNDKPGYLQVPENALRLEPDQVPEDLKKALDDYHKQYLDRRR